jgi:hypothetical protein
MWAWGAFAHWPTVLLMPMVTTIASCLYFFARTFRTDGALARIAKSIACGSVIAAALNVGINGIVAGPMEVVIAGWLGLFAIVVSLVLMGFHLLIFRRAH